MNPNPLADLVEAAAHGARDDSAIEDAELVTLKEVAKVLRDENCNSVDNLKERLAHYCE